MRAINVREQRSCSFHSSSACCCCPTLLTNSIHSCHLPVTPPHLSHWMPLAMHFWFTLLFFLLFALLAFATPPLDAQRGTATRRRGASGIGWYAGHARSKGRGEGGRPAGQLHLPTLCACTLHMAQRRRRPVAVCVDIFSASISHFCVIFIPSTYSSFEGGGRFTTEVHNYH